jgi:dTDP-4-amino-4,6-dideoxygalactose transaminase
MRCSQDVGEWGYKFHMNDVTATVGLAQLPHLPQVVAAHRANAAFYDGAFAGRVDRAGGLPGSRGAWWLYTLLLADAEERELFAKHMAAAGVSVSQVHSRNDTMTCFAPYRGGRLRGVDEFTARMCCIPVHWGLSEQDRQRVADAVLDFRR